MADKTTNKTRVYALENTELDIKDWMMLSIDPLMDDKFSYA